jgi:hypothetical protein
MVRQHRREGHRDVTPIQVFEFYDWLKKGFDMGLKINSNVGSKKVGGPIAYAAKDKEALAAIAALEGVFGPGNVTVATQKDIDKALGGSVPPVSLDEVLDLASKYAEATTSIKFPDGTLNEAKEAVGKPSIFAGPTCNIGVNAKTTINLGSYNSATVGVSINIPCAHTELDPVFAFAKSWVDKKMDSLIEQINAAKDKTA